MAQSLKSGSYDPNEWLPAPRAWMNPYSLSGGLGNPTVYGFESGFSPDGQLRIRVTDPNVRDQVFNALQQEGRR